MLFLNSQMHLVTFGFVVAELFLLGQQVYQCLCRPADSRNLWYLVLLVLLLVYNIVGSIFPGTETGISLSFRTCSTMAAVFLMVSYFPLYFYKAFDLKTLRFHALYGLPLFFILPVLVFFVGWYGVMGDLDFAVTYGIIAPGVYGAILLGAILYEVRKKATAERLSLYEYRKSDLLAIYYTVLPWIAMAVFPYFDIPQWVEALVTNTGFILMTLMFIGFVSDNRQSISNSTYTGPVNK